jgi:hypothetical protein
MKIHTYHVIFYILTPAFVWAQQIGVNLGYNPQKNTENLIPFSAPLNSPDVHNDRIVTFRVKAHEAKNVKFSRPVMIALNAWSRSMPFIKDKDGILLLTIGPIEQDMYIYYFEVEGVHMRRLDAGVRVA